MKPAAGKAAAAPQEAPSCAGCDRAAFAARVLVGLILIATGALKAAAPKEEFAVVIDWYDVLPQGMSLAVAAFLPWVELVIGWSLLLGWFTREFAAAAFGLAVCFFGAVASTQLRGIPLPNCGCFGGAIHMPLWGTMLLDAVLAALSFVAFRRAPAGPSLDNWATGPHT